MEASEKIYLRGDSTEVDVKYLNLKLLKLLRNMKKENCSTSCINLSKELT